MRTCKTEETTKPAIFAHRGARLEFPENTMSAFRAAYDLGADGIELDLQRTADGVLVICHDENLERLASVNVDLKDLTWRQLSELNAGHAFPESPEERFPSLEEFLSWFAWTSLTVNIEIKNSVYPYPLIESEILYAIDQYKLRDRVIISSFSLESVVEMKHLAPDLSCAFLFKRHPYRALNAALEYGLDALHPHYANTFVPGFVSRCRHHNIAVRLWTVNSPRVTRFAIRQGIDTLITDDPAQALRIRDEWTMRRS